MAKNQPKEKSKREAATAAGKAAVGGTMKLLVWVVLIVAAVLLIWRAVITPPDEGRTDPGILVETYTDFVGVYGTRGAPRPSQINVREWLTFFDDDFEDWFMQNADRFAMLSMRNPDEWRGSTREDRESEAMVYIVSQQPFRGGRVETKRLMDEGATAQVTFARPSGTYTADLALDGEEWVFTSQFGLREYLDEQAAGVTLPGVVSD